jgi:hypothetical protein
MENENIELHTNDFTEFQVNSFKDYQNLLKDYFHKLLWNKPNENLETNEVMSIVKRVDYLFDFIIDEFSKDPLKAEYFVEYSINLINGQLTENYDYREDENVNPFNKYLNNPIYENLNLDISFNAFNGAEIQKHNISKEVAEEMSSFFSNCSIWGYVFYTLLEFQSRLNELYSNKFELSFFLNRIEEEKDGELFGIKNISNIKKSKSIKEPTNKDKCKALLELCPELIKKLHSHNKETKENIIHLITGVNKTDSYKFIFTADRKEIDRHKNEDIEMYKSMIIN